MNLPHFIARRIAFSKSRSFTKVIVRIAIAAIAAAALYGCSPSIWNAGDLAEWVRGEAIEQGCKPGTIVLEEWYTQTASGNVWRGTCETVDKPSQSFGVNVDDVWTPSG